MSGKEIRTKQKNQRGCVKSCKKFEKSAVFLNSVNPVVTNLERGFKERNC